MGRHKVEIGLILSVAMCLAGAAYTAYVLLTGIRL